MKNQKIKVLVECAILIALATVLSMIKVYDAPLGGSVTLFSMVPIIIIGFRHGTKWGLASAFVYSCLQLLLGLGNVAYVPTAVGIVLCILFDYTLAFTSLGLAGILKSERVVRNLYVRVICGTLLVCVLRYVFHVVSGAVVWYEITKVGEWNDLVQTLSMWPYSIIYNAQYMVPETIITLIGVPVVVKIINVIKPAENRKDKKSFS